jgi:DnaK suppressor protein
VRSSHKFHMQKKKNTTQSRPKAATADVLSRPANSDVKINPKWERNYQHLVELRDYFLIKKGELTRDANEEQPSYSEHMADAGTDSYDRDFALGMLTSGQDALYEIEEAIRRIQDGSYGTCELTGKPIQAKRLNAIPWTRFSIEAERDLESNGVLAHPKLGNLGSVADSGADDEEDQAGESKERENPGE